MSAPHLLSLSAMHRDGPGSLDVVFGPDGTFAGAPRWVGPVLTPQGYRHSLRGVTISRRPDLPGGILINGIGDRVYLSADVALDCRIPSVYDRLRRLIERVHGGIGWPSPEDLASLTLSLAPRIAALGGTRV